VKVTLSAVVPEGGTVAGVVQLKVPATEAVPPLSADEASVWPTVMEPAVGQADTVGVALFTVIVTDAVAVLYVAVSVGVKVTLSEGVPAPGAVVDVVHEKVPATEAVPPLRVDEDRVWP
jgi:hypothetical protein